MTTETRSRKIFLKKKKDALTKVNSFRENFRKKEEDFIKKEREIKADLEEASRIWKELSERFKWWQTLP